MKKNREERNDQYPKEIKEQDKQRKQKNREARNNQDAKEIKEQVKKRMK